jgi:hypothetical protein
LATVLCCAASTSAAADDVDPVVKAAAVDASRRNEAREPPACQVDRPDALSDGRLHLRPGDRLCVTLRLSERRVEPVALVKSTEAADALVVTARLQGGRTFLALVNPLGESLRYKAWMRRAGKGMLEYTSSCPVLSGHRLAFEDWPFAIDELVLAAFELEAEVDTDDKLMRVECR